MCMQGVLVVLVVMDVMVVLVVRVVMDVMVVLIEQMILRVDDILKSAPRSGCAYRVC